MFVMDMGYFITPYLGGAMVNLNSGYAVLFDAGASLTLMALVLAIILKRMGPAKGAVV
jgi:predicted MFS family arabinose efflux permease